MHLTLPLHEHQLCFYTKTHGTITNLNREYEGSQICYCTKLGHTNYIRVVKTVLDDPSS